MNEQEVNQKFNDITRPKIIQQITKQKRPPAKFPELRYLWGITLLGSFALMVLAAIIQTFLDMQIQTLNICQGHRLLWLWKELQGGALAHGDRKNIGRLR